MIRWMQSFALDMENHIHDILKYDNRMYVLVFWVNFLAVWLLILEPLLLLRTLFRKLKQKPVSTDDNDIPF